MKFVAFVVIAVMSLFTLTGCFGEEKAEYLPPLSDCVNANTDKVKMKCKDPVIRKKKDTKDVSCTFPTKACQEKAKKENK